MQNLTEIFCPEEGEAIILMPLTRVLSEAELVVGNLTIFPPGDLEILKTDAAPLLRKNLVEFQSQCTGFSSDLLDKFAIVGFCTHLEWRKLEQHSHDEDITLLSQLSGFAERSFDLLRLYNCSLDFPDTLPGPIGVWDISTPYMGALVYFSEINKWCEIAGAASSYTTIVSGIGLDLYGCDYHNSPPSELDGKVGAIAVHALSLLSDAMYARNDTAKFVRTMTLLEFLGSPDEYKQWQKLKGQIACHISRNKEDYEKRLKELRSFTSMENAQGDQVGYRTLIVHHGKFLEDILPERDERRKLFRRLHEYCRAVIIDLLANPQMTWSEFLDLRKQKKLLLGVTN